MLKADITKHYGSSGHGWYGVPKHRVNVRYDDGTKKVFQGTYRSVRCQAEGGSCAASIGNVGERNFNFAAAATTRE